METTPVYRVRYCSELPSVGTDHVTPVTCEQEVDPDVSEFLSLGGRLDPWDAQLRDGLYLYRPTRFLRRVRYWRCVLVLRVRIVLRRSWLGHVRY
eukprot:2433974-Rhodomonas_salina.1